MLRRILIVLAVVALAAAVIFGIVHAYESWRGHVYLEGDANGAARVQHAWDQDVTKRAAATLVAVAKARKEEQETAARAAEGEARARQQAEKQAEVAKAAAGRAAAAAGGLRDTIAVLDAAARAAGAPSAAACPAQFAAQRDAAIRARAVLGACSAEYRSLAQAADGDLAAVTLKLDTAMGWINATGAPGASP